MREFCFLRDFFKLYLDLSGISIIERRVGGVDDKRLHTEGLANESLIANEAGHAR